MKKISSIFENLKLSIPIVAIIFILIVSSHADLVYLKNGKIVEGDVQNSVGNLILVDTPGGTISIQKDMIDRIQKQAKPNIYISYLIEVSSQVRREDSERALNYLLSQGFESANIIYEPPYYKVQVGPYIKESDAISAAQKIDKLPVPFASSNKAHIIQQQITAKATETPSPTSPIQTNIALAINGAKATADSHQSDDQANKAIDGNTQDLNSRWLSYNSPGPHWLAVDFKEPKPIHRIEVYSGEEHDAKYILKEFTVQYWSGTEWRDLGGIKNNLIENPVFNFDTVTTQRVRIYIKQSSYVDQIARIYEVKVMSGVKRELAELPTEQRIQYNFEIAEPDYLNKEKPEIKVKSGEWYSIPMRITYDIGTISGFSASIQPDSQNYWSDTKFRDYLGISPDEYITTVYFDTKNNTKNPTLEGMGDISFTLKSRAPETPGIYTKKLRFNLYNPIRFSVQKSKEIEFSLIAE